VTTVRRTLAPIVGFYVARVATALGIDPDLDLDTHRLVAVPTCETCAMCDGVGEVAKNFGAYGPGRPEIVRCPACRGTGMDLERADFPRTLPKCEACGGSGYGISAATGEVVGVTCPVCRGTGNAGVPVILPAEIAEHLPALLRIIHYQAAQENNLFGLPAAVWHATYEWSEAQP
jgi:DnaJ-class molecular chaperone